MRVRTIEQRLRGRGWHTASKELEICYVMSNDHSPANMKKDFFFGSRRGRGGWRFLSDSGRSVRVGRPFRSGRGSWKREGMVNTVPGI